MTTVRIGFYNSFKWIVCAETSKYHFIVYGEDEIIIDADYSFNICLAEEIFDKDEAAEKAINIVKEIISKYDIKPNGFRIGSLFTILKHLYEDERILSVKCDYFFTEHNTPVVAMDRDYLNLIYRFESSYSERCEEDRDIIFKDYGIFRSIFDESYKFYRKHILKHDC